MFVFDYVFWCLVDDGVFGVVFLVFGVFIDLFEVVYWQDDCCSVVVFVEFVEEYCMDGNVDVDVEGVGVVDDLQQFLLGQLFDEQVVFWQQVCVVYVDVEVQNVFDFFVVGCVEVEVVYCGVYCYVLFMIEQFEVCQVLCQFGVFVLCEVDDVDW